MFKVGQKVKRLESHSALHAGTICYVHKVIGESGRNLNISLTPGGEPMSHGTRPLSFSSSRFEAVGPAPKERKRLLLC